MAKITVGFEVPRKDGWRKVVFNLSHRGGRKRIPSDIDLSPKDVTKDRNGNLKVKSEAKRFEIDETLHSFNERLHQLSKESLGEELRVSRFSRCMMSKLGEEFLQSEHEESRITDSP